MSAANRNAAIVAKFLAEHPQVDNVHHLAYLPEGSAARRTYEAQCEAPGSTEIAGIFERHYRMMLEFYGAELGLRQARKHVAWYLDRHAVPLSAGLKGVLLTSREPEFVVSRVRDLLLAAPATDMSEAA